MRFVPINAIRPGMVNAKPLYGHNQEVLLREGVALNEHIIQRIVELGYNGIYADYHPDSDIEFVEIIDNQLRIEAVTKIKKAFLSVSHKPSVTEIIDQKKDLSQTVEKLIDEIINNRHLMVNLIDLKVFDDYTFYHSVNVAVITLVLGVAMGMNRTELYRLGLAALLHDIGKIMIPREIMDKPGRLTPEEFEIMKGHSDEGYRYLRDVYDVPVQVYMAVKFHHEQTSGEGYPMGLTGPDIPLFSKLISISDVFDALTSDRVYRKALSPSEAVEYVMGNSGQMFDQEIVRIFLKKVAPYPVGTAVLLSDQRVGIVVANAEGFGLRPIVQVVQQGQPLETPYTVDLKELTTVDVTILGIYQGADLYL